MTHILHLTRPDDWHLHLRDGAILQAVLPYSVRHFARALIMPNLAPPIITAADAIAYKARIQAALPIESNFTPLMTLYLTEQTNIDDLAGAFNDGIIHAVKYYPAGATTQSQFGVRNIKNVMVILEHMAVLGIPLCIHGEITHPHIDIFDRETVFIDTVLAPLHRALPELKITLEHITTQSAIDYIKTKGKNLCGSITTHHLLINRTHMLAGGIKPHYYCLPVPKHEAHRRALCRAATSGDARFFLGTDSAPHIDRHKLAACGCAGCFTAANCLPCLAHIFEEEKALAHLNAFVALNGAAHYALPPNQEKMTLTKVAPPAATKQYPEFITIGAERITLFNPGFQLLWQVD